ncbi:hypothetical protein SteCoe_19268 [Stentor coeruleus]|uniref:ERCC4 domain-containing protein n=1 Tax=Stentor coeruleus TaxID=5963 RepID=A0A1R2BV61_9CILI|nr:hypothetical protein SteCoe_19268 [Stentor coeruleus]
MELEYIVYFPDHFNNEELFANLAELKICYQFYNSSIHHPQAILLHRTRYSKKIISQDHAQNFSKVALIYYPSIPSTEDLQQTLSTLSVYAINNIKTLIILEGIDDHLESLSLTEKTNSVRDTIEEWLCQIFLKGVDCIKTDSTKHTVNIIHRILTILTHSPYNILPSIFKIPSKKLQTTSEIPEGSKLWAEQLINIPGVSEQKVGKIIEKFPNLTSLMEFYHCTEKSSKEKIDTIALMFERKQKKLSSKVYKVYSSDNPNDIV